MSQQELSTDAIVQSHDSIDIMASVLRFYRSALRRKTLVICCFIFSFTLAAVYYATATRLYQSSAELFVLHAGGNVLDEKDRSKSDLSAQMPDFERVLQSDSVLKVALKSLPPEHRIDFHDVPAERWLNHFRDRLSVSTVKRTNVMAISYRSVNPETAFLVVDSLLECYVKFMNSMHQDTKQANLQILMEAKEKTAQELRLKQQQLLELKSQSQVIFGSKTQLTNVLDQSVLELRKAYDLAKMETANAKALWESAQAAYQRGEDMQEFASRLDESLGSNLLQAQMGIGSRDSYAMAQMERDLLQLRREFNAKQEILGPNHPKLKELSERIQESERYLRGRPGQMQEEFQKLSREQLGPQLVALIARQYQLAVQREREMGANFIATRDEALKAGYQLTQMEQLQDDVDLLRAQLSKEIDGIKENLISKESGINVRTITPPSIDRRPVTPKLSMTGVMGVALGLLLSTISVYVLDFFDDRFHSPDDLRFTLNSPILAMIRKLPVLAQTGLASLYPYAKPNSVESEAFRSLRTAIDFSPDQLRCLTISSTEPSDGKTTVVASLAVVFAQAGKRTLVIDGDMRRPGASRLFELSTHHGLSNILRDQRDVEQVAVECVVHTSLPKLDVIASGPRPMNPVELLASDRFAELILWAQSNYDQILIDAPPSLAVADVQVIGRLVDAAILTVRPDKNRRKMVVRAAEALTSLGCPLLGLVVNHVEPKHGDDYAYGYGYGYGDGYGHNEQDLEEAGFSRAA
ncbi:polysaccharide biosynthesis tyrosine autokinase [Planctomicrobium sp. SH664]|uniref:polysaccharide biosynthesis tyrosine autokinase n=1 Tax=Planctomicrobium sp. SH664 TaxID=3448125 RepID=UPI003F5B4203